MARIIAVANQKGGVGKTTTCVNLAAALAGMDYNVLLVDLDPQGNASTGCGVDARTLERTAFDVMTGEASVADTLVSLDELGFDLLPSNSDLTAAEVQLLQMEGREYRLRDALEQVAHRYGWIIIDCPPSLNMLTLNALAGANSVLIPIQCEYYALEGLSQLLKNIEMIQKHLNPELSVSTILLTMYDGRTNLASQVAEEVRNHFPAEVLETMIPRSVRISEAPSYQQSVISYDPSSTGALSYLEAAAEIAQRAQR